MSNLRAMPFWTAFGVSAVAFFGFLAILLREEGETDKTGFQTFKVIYCHAFTFCALTILLFEVDDTVFVVCATLAFVLALLFAVESEVRVPWLAWILNFGVAIAIGSVAAVEAREHGWTDTLRAAEILSFIATYAAIITPDGK